MKILQVIPVFSAPFGGPVTVVRSISKELAKRHEVTVYTTCALDQRRDFKDSPFEVESDGYRVVYFPRILRFSRLFSRVNISPTMARALNETISEYDVVHLHSWRHFQDMIVHYYAMKYGVPYVLQARGSLPRIGAWRKLKWIYDVLFGYGLLRDASKVVALSRVEAEQYKAMGVPEEKIAIIPNGIDSEYADLPPKGAFKKKFGISEDKKIILYLGRIHRTKGIDFLIKAYAYLVRNSNFNDVVLVIAGPDDGYLREAKQLVASLGISERTIFPGLLVGREKIATFIDASICAYLRPNEPFGNVSLEAAASETPVVVCEDTPMSNIVKDGNFGFSVKYGDVTGLVNVFKTVLSNEGFKKEMGKHGREYVFKNFSWDKIIDQLEDLYEQVITKAKDVK